jgi:hypothetical protein
LALALTVFGLFLIVRPQSYGKIILRAYEENALTRGTPVVDWMVWQPALRMVPCPDHVRFQEVGTAWKNRAALTDEYLYVCKRMYGFDNCRTEERRFAEQGVNRMGARFSRRTCVSLHVVPVRPARLTGLVNAWCFSGFTKRARFSSRMSSRPPRRGGGPVS